MAGLVHSIETFSTLDGPGIRTVVFLQGCLLRCIYCQNPDTWPVWSSAAHEYTAGQILELLEGNHPYFEASGGGLTFSGGEPLLQHYFVKEVFTGCRDKQIHTAFESSLSCRAQYVEEVLPFTNLVLADLKCPDPDKGRNLTGSSSKASLKNLYLINAHQIPVWMRYVILPGWTDSPAQIKRISALAQQLECVQRLELLPYHTLGRHKWALLGMSYQLEDINPPEPASLQNLAQIASLETSKPVLVR